MQITTDQLNPTTVKLTIVADAETLNAIKARVLRKLGQNLKVPGFRPGKAPETVVEKQLDQNVLQTEFLDEALNSLYVQAVEQQKLRPVSQPKVSITKFVPFSDVEVTMEIEVVGEVQLPDYKKIRLAKKPVKVETSEVNEVLENLRQRAATKTDVKRAAQEGDEVTIDFNGIDSKSKQPIDGADGKDYPLVLGSKVFIPGFETNLVGLKNGESKSFDLKFPDDYGAAILQGKSVTFSVTVKQVKKLTLPTLNDTFATTVGPFKAMAELKTNIKQQLEAEKQTQAQRDFESELLEMLANKATVAIPVNLVEEEINRQEADEKQNLLYRGQTWEEHLEQEGVTPEEHREKQRPAAELRVKAGLVLSEVAEAEGLTVTPEEVDMRIQLLKGQYQDTAMQAELDKPAARRDIASRLLSEKTINKLSEYATQ